MGLKDLPLGSGSQHVKAFARAGWVKDRRTGSHQIMVKDGEEATLSVPLHKELKRGTLDGLIDAAGMSHKEYCDHYYKRSKKAK